MTHRQQQQLPALTSGSAESTPMNNPPQNAGCSLSFIVEPRLPASVVVLETEMGDQFLALNVAQRVLQLHQLNEQVVLRIEPRRVHRRLEVERQPLLDALHPRALREVEEQRHI